MNLPAESPRLTRRGLLRALGAGTAAAALPAWSQGSGGWPAKPVRIIVPFAAGVAPDVVARIVGDPLSRAIGQPVIIDNRAGAAGIIGAEAAARSAPDGYTFFVAVQSIIGVNPHVYAKLPYDALRDFMPVTQVALVPYMLVTGPNQPFASLKDLLDKARAKPGDIAYASYGVGTGVHVVTEMMNNLAGVRMLHVPYKGSPLSDVMGGQIPLLFEPVATAAPLVKAGKLKALAVSSPRRIPGFPDVPAVAEVLPGFDGDGWIALYAPAGTPAEIVQRVNAEVVRVLQQPALRDKIVELGMQPVGNSVDAFTRISRQEYDKWTAVTRDNRIRAD